MKGEQVRNVQSRSQHMYGDVMSFMVWHPVGVVLAAVLAAVFALLYAATHLAFDSNRLDLVSAAEHYTQLNAAFSREFEDLPGSMVVVLQSQDPERAKAFATALAQRWQTDSHDELTDLRQQLQAHHV
jgi:predicted RND superfamily exporter protein